jgi:two-component system sensor histidine kinase KdpD
MGRGRNLTAGATAVAAITLIAWRFHPDLATAAFLHLIVVVLLARRSGFRIAGAVALVAIACQAYFLVPPYLSFVVADGHNVIALATFGYCALTVSRLSSEAALQADMAEKRRRETEGLYEISRLVLLMDRRSEPGPQIAQMIARVFDCKGIAIFDASSSTAAADGAAMDVLEERARSAFLADRDDFDSESHLRMRVLRMGHRPVGAFALLGPGVSDTVADALASLIAVAMERARSFENESRVEAARQSEQLRTAVLDALAHDVKTPLTAIRAASSGLLEAHVLDPLHEELVSLIDNESARLDEITNRLLRLARLDARDVRVKRASLRIDQLLDRTVDPARRRVPDRIIRLHCGPSLTVSGDDQLLSMAISQLVDNALKYSRPDTGMTVKAERLGSEALISVHNLGYPIPESDLERIFERFYRAGDVAHRVSGTGLGLSITRKIALAHGGRVWASSDEAHGTTFFLSLPIFEEALP